MKDEIRKQEPGFNAICNTCDLKLKMKCEANCLENIIWLYQYRIWQGQCNERIIILVAYKDHCHCFNWSSNERKEIKLWILYLFKIYIYCLCIWFPTKFIRLIWLSIDFQGLNVLKKYWISSNYFIQTMHSTEREREREVESINAATR